MARVAPRCPQPILGDIGNPPNRGRIDVVDLGFGVLTVPDGDASRLLDEILPAEAHYEAVEGEDDPDLISR
jgi:hypothetical protein